MGKKQNYQHVFNLSPHEMFVNTCMHNAYMKSSEVNTFEVRRAAGNVKYVIKMCLYMYIVFTVSQFHADDHSVYLVFQIT